MKHYHIFYRTTSDKFGRAAYTGPIRGPKDLAEMEKWLQSHFGGGEVVIVCWQPFDEPDACIVVEQNVETIEEGASFVGVKIGTL